MQQKALPQQDIPKKENDETGNAMRGQVSTTNGLAGEGGKMGQYIVTGADKTLV